MARMKIDREIVGGCLPVRNRRARKRPSRVWALISLKEVESGWAHTFSLPDQLAGLELWVCVAEAAAEAASLHPTSRGPLRVDLAQASPDCRNLATRLTYQGSPRLFG